MKSFLKFSLIVFFPLFALMLIYVGGIFFIALTCTNPGLATHSDWKSTVFFFFSHILVVAAIFLIAFPCYFFYRRAEKSVLMRIAILYCFWLLFIFPLAYLLSAALAGVSMAVVDGVVKGRELTNQILAHTSWLILLSHIFIIPWVAISILLLRFFKVENT